MDDPFCQFGYRDLLGSTQVEHPPECVGILRQREHASDDVVDTTEATGLPAVSEHGDRFSPQRLSDEPRDYHSVTPGLTRSDRVEQPHDDRLEALFTPVGVRQDLVDRLGLGVGPPTLQRRPENPIVIFRQTVRGVLPVDLGRRGDQDPLAVLVGLLEDRLRPSDVGHEALERLLDNQVDTHRRSEMEDDIDPRDDMVDEIHVEHRAEHELTVGVTLEMGDVGESPGREVVEQEHLIAAPEKPIRQMRSNKARSTGDQGTHQASLSRAQIRPLTVRSRRDGGIAPRDRPRVAPY